MTARHKAFIFLLIVAAIWGFASPIIKFGFEFLSPDIFLTYRFLISTLIMVPLLLKLEPDTWKILGRLSAKDYLLLALGGFLGSTVQLGLLFWGLNLTTSLDGSIINATSPILIALAGHYFLKEKVTTLEKIGLIVAFFGSIIIVIQPALVGKPLFSGAAIGNFLVLLGTLAWVGYVLLTKTQLNHKLSPWLLTTNMFVVGFISMSVFVFFRYQPSTFHFQLSTAPIGAHLAVLYMAVFSGTLAYWLYQKAQKVIEASEANIFLYLSPIFTIPLSVYWLHEPVSIFLVSGSILITLGVIVSEIKR